MLDGRFFLLSGFPREDSGDADYFRGGLRMPPSKRLDGKWNEDDLFPLAGLEGLGIFTAFCNFEGMAGDDGGSIHRGALKRIDDGDVVGGVSAPDPAPDEDVGGASVIARKESAHFSSRCKAGGDGATVKVVA